MTALSLGLLVPNRTISLEGVARNLLFVTAGTIIGSLVPVVGAYLAAARTEVIERPAQRNTRLNPSALRAPPSSAAE